MPTSQSKRTQCIIKQTYSSSENKMKFGGASFFGRDANEPLSAHSSVRTKLDDTKQENTMYYRHQISISVLWKQDELCRCLLSLEKMHWHNEAVGSPHSRSKDVNAKIPTSKSQTTRYGVVYKAIVLVHHKRKARVHNIPLKSNPTYLSSENKMKFAGEPPLFGRDALAQCKCWISS